MSRSFQLIFILKNVQSNTFSIFSTDDEIISDRKENERETNRKCHPVIGNELYDEVMNCLQSKLKVH